MVIKGFPVHYNPRLVSLRKLPLVSELPWSSASMVLSGTREEFVKCGFTCSSPVYCNISSVDCTWTSFWSENENWSFSFTLDHPLVPRTDPEWMLWVCGCFALF